MLNKVLLTGGHLAPAIAVLEALQKEKANIVFVGKEHAFADNLDQSLEETLLKQYPNVKYYGLNTGRFQGLFTWSLFSEMYKTFRSFFKALSILRQEKPSSVITFGGYVALPISLAAALKRIPFYLHEQTLSPGLANILLSFLARKVFVTFPETVKRFPLHNGQSLGNPIKNFLQMERRPDWFRESDKPLILILGGSAGSHSINLILEKIIPELSQKYFLIHQTGDSSYRDYDRLVKFKSASSYLPVKFIHPHELHFLFQKANLVITRSGANTFFSLLYFQKPSILIPLPWARNNEQYKQANLLKDLKVAEIFPQTSEATSLIKLVETVFRNEKEYRHHFSQTGSHLNLIVDAKELLAKIHD